MLEWTAAGDGARFMGLVHHTDAEREWAYDRNSHVGKLDKALDEANTRGWTVVDMKNDWKVVFPPEKPGSCCRLLRIAAIAGRHNHSKACKGIQKGY